MSFLRVLCRPQTQRAKETTKRTEAGKKNTKIEVAFVSALTVHVDSLLFIHKIDIHSFIPNRLFTE